MIVFVIRAAIFAALIFAAVGARAQWTFDVEPALIYDNNLPRAQRAGDIRSDQAAALSGTAIRSIDLDDSSDLRVGAHGQAIGYERFTGVSHTTFGASVAWHRKLGLGLTAPWIEATVLAERERYQEELRDGDRYLVTLSAGRRFNEIISALAGFSLDRRRALHDLPVDAGVSGRVFDLQGRSLFGRGSVAVSQRLVVTLDVSARRGDVVSSSREDPAFDPQTSAVALDPAFGPGYEAYRLFGITKTIALGASFALNDRSSINLSALAEHTQSGGGIEYSNTQVHLRYLIRY